MKTLTLFMTICFSIMVSSQTEDLMPLNDQIKTLIASNFKSMEIFSIKGGQRLLTKKYVYQKIDNEVIIYDYSNEKEQNLLHVDLKIDSNGNIIEERKVFEGEVYEGGKMLVKKYEFRNSILYAEDNIQITSYNSHGEISSKDIILLDDKKRKIELIKIFNIPNDIVISKIVKYKWDSDGHGYEIEQNQFSYPKQKLIGYYKLDQYGNITSFKGDLYVHNKKEDMSGDFEKKINKFDSKGNLIQIYSVDNGKQTLIEDRKIFY